MHKGWAFILQAKNHSTEPLTCITGHQSSFKDYLGTWGGDLLSIVL